MRYLIRACLLLAFFLLLVFIAPMLMGNSGYVLIAAGSYTFELTLVGLAVILIVVFAALYAVGKLVAYSIRSSGNMGKWFKGRASRQQETAFYNGLFAVALGNESLAERELAKVSNQAFKGFPAVALGQLALQQNNTDAAEQWFYQAKQSGNAAAEKAADILLAQHYMFTRQPDLALDTLAPFGSTADTDVIKIKARALFQTGQWDILQSALPGWKKALGEDYSQLSEQLTLRKLGSIASKEGALELKKYWDSLPRKERNDLGYRASLLTLLVDQGMFEDTQTYLHTWYKKGVIPEELLPMVKHLRLPNPAQIVELLERSIKKQPNTAQLYAALGHVAFHSNDLELGEKALVKALTIEETQDELLLLADIHQQTHASDKAMQVMRRIAQLQHQ